MIEKNVTATQAITTAGKADYPSVVLHYTKEDGTPGKIGNFAAKLDSDTRAKLKTVVAGTVLSVKIDKNEDTGYWNLMSAGEPIVETTKTYGNKDKKPTGGYDSLGNQIGNCITNSVNSLGEGKTPEEYKKRAVDFLVMGDEIRANAEAGNYKNKLPTPILEDALTITSELKDDKVTEALGW